MMQTKTIDDLHRLGDALERASERDLEARPRRLVRNGVLAVAAALVIGSGTAVAAGLFTPASRGGHAGRGGDLRTDRSSLRRGR